MGALIFDMERHIWYILEVPWDEGVLWISCKLNF